MLKKIVYIFLFFLIGGVILGGLYFWNQVNWPVSSSDEEVYFVIKRGEGVKQIAAHLKDEGLIRSIFWFETYVFFDQTERQFYTGSYILKPNMNIREIVNILTSGNVKPELIITIIEGWDVRDIADYLDKNNIVDNDEFLTAAETTDTRTIIPDKEYDFLKDKPRDQGLEGYLFPDTYRIFEDASAADIIEKMLDNFGVKFTDEMRQAAAERGMSIHEVVTLASIVEQEVRTEEDRKIAAGIFYDRLAAGVPLQSDATVNYVTGKNLLRPTAEDIAVDSPYNTYKYKGLPPGPISNPSLSALRAVLYPVKSDYFYFLTKPDGSTVFSKTYEEHLENKRKYLQ